MRCSDILTCHVFSSPKVDHATSLAPRHGCRPSAPARYHARMKRRIRFLVFTCAAAVSAGAAGAAETNDYPTSARADYVFGCMKVNGETRQALEQCSCSIDVIASII